MAVKKAEWWLDCRPVWAEPRPLVGVAGREGSHQMPVVEQLHDPGGVLVDGDGTGVHPQQSEEAEGGRLLHSRGGVAAGGRGRRERGEGEEGEGGGEGRGRGERRRRGEGGGGGGGGRRGGRGANQICRFHFLSKCANSQFSCVDMQPPTLTLTSGGAVCPSPGSPPSL